MSTPDPGWYDDPAAPGQLRWWDGTAWTEQTRQAPPLPPPPAPSPRPDQGVGTPPPPPPPRASESRPRVPDPDLGAGDPYDLFGPSTGSGTGPPGPLQAAASRRRGIAVVVALGVVGIGAAIAFALSQGGNVFDLEVGSCFNDDLEASGDEELVIDDVDIVSCDEPHDNEVYDAWDYEGVRYPGSATIGDVAIESCLDRFTTAVGVPVELTDLDVSGLWPTQESWDVGDREILCVLYAFDGSQLTGSRRGLVSQDNAFTLGRGDCFDAPSLDPEVAEPTSGIEVRDCEQEHFGQVHETFDVDGATWPGHDEVADLADERCLDAFEPFVGEPWETSALYYGAFRPSQESWDAGDRTVVCYLYDPVNGPISGEASAWALAHPVGDVDLGSDYDVSHLAVGDCFDDDFETGEFGSLSCDQPHDNEVFAVFDLDEGPWPGPGEVADEVARICDPAFEDWVGTDRSDLGWFSFHPNEQSWAQGNRHVVCALYDADLEPLTGSQRRSPV